MASETDPASSFEQLLQQVSKLKGKLNGIAVQATPSKPKEASDGSGGVEETVTTTAPKPSRPKVERMSAKVSESNPYSRVMALERMGVVDNYQAIREKSIVIVGLGGIGAVAVRRFLFSFFPFSFFFCFVYQLAMYLGRDACPLWHWQACLDGL